MSVVLCRLFLAGWFAVSSMLPLLPCGCWSTAEPSGRRSEEGCGCCQGASESDENQGTLARADASPLVCWGEDPRGHWSLPVDDDDPAAATSPPALPVLAGRPLAATPRARREPPTPPKRGPTLEELSVYRI